MNFLLITVSGGSSKAIEVLQSRIDAGLYPLNESTKYRRDISPGDRVFFYIGSSKSRRASYSSFMERGKAIAGEAIVEAKIPERKIPREVQEGLQADLLYVHEYLKLQNVRLYPDAVPFESLAARLSITCRSPDWRACLMGGAKKLNEADADIVNDFLAAA